MKVDKIIEVPKDYIKCSVCGLYKDKMEYRNEGDKAQDRINCSVCYNLSPYEMDQLSFRTEQYFKNNEKYQALVNKINKTNGLIESSISVNNLIRALESLPEDSRILITQDGYYAESDYASIFYLPKKQDYDEDIMYYSIGHSSQNY